MHNVDLGEIFDGVLGAARAGEGWAWEAIYRDLSPAVLGYLRAQGVPEPEDLTAEVFLHVVRDIRRFAGGEGEFRAWVLAIAHNRLVDQRRSVKRRPADILTGEIEHGEAGGNVEEEALAEISEKRTRRLLARLSHDQQSVLLLRILGDLTVAQVAAVLGRTPGGVKALQRRGLATLKRELSRMSVTL